MNFTKDFIVGSLDNIGFVCIESKFQGKWVLSFHEKRQKWECPGGHVKEGETALAAAKRELYEETGAKEFDIIPVWDYSFYREDGSLINNGRVYYADIKSFYEIPDDSEMCEISFFSIDEFPQNVTYDRNEMIEMLKKAEKCVSVNYE